jgi:phosphate transport system protein
MTDRRLPRAGHNRLLGFAFRGSLGHPVNSPNSPHTSKEYDEQLARARGLVQEMGATVERQLRDAIECLASGSEVLIDEVMGQEAVVNALERTIDELCSQIIARRQPAAADLRVLLALIKTTTDLERVGDEAKKIALQARKIFAGGGRILPRYVEIRHMAHVGREMLRGSLAALERTSVEGTAAVMRRDEEVNDAFRAILRQLISFMIEDPRTIGSCLDIVFVAKALERVGDHAKNIAEYVIYAVKGKDVRHVSVAEVERELDAED